MPGLQEPQLNSNQCSQLKLLHQDTVISRPGFVHFWLTFLPSYLTLVPLTSFFPPFSPLGLCLLIHSTPDSLSSGYLRRDAAGGYVRPSLIRGQTSEHRGSTFLVAKPVGSVPRTEGLGAPMLSEIPDQLYSHALCLSLPLRKETHYLNKKNSKSNAARGTCWCLDWIFFFETSLIIKRILWL